MLKNIKVSFSKEQLKSAVKGMQLRLNDVTNLRDKFDMNSDEYIKLDDVHVFLKIAINSCKIIIDNFAYTDNGKYIVDTQLNSMIKKYK